jgi:gamma-glutamylcyclotransferase (GGCT)/AIG2-like uncharacterized protein YtfP
VSGDLYCVRRGAAILRTLDRYERGPAGRGPPSFVRARRAVRPLGIARAAQLTAWVYVYRGNVLSRPRIRSGDYRTTLEAAAS